MPFAKSGPNVNSAGSNAKRNLFIQTYLTPPWRVAIPAVIDERV